MRRFFLITILLFIHIVVFASVTHSTDLTLNDLFALALKNSERIMIAEEEFFIAERGKEKALSALLPKFTAFSNYTRYTQDRRSSAGSIIQPEESSSWGLRIEQPLFTGGRNIAGLEIAKGQVEAERKSLSFFKEDYLFQVASVYFDVLKGRRNVEIGESQVRRLLKHRKAAEIRLKVGEVTKTALLRAEAELSAAESELIKAKNAYKQAKDYLARLTGITTDYDVAGPSISDIPQGDVKDLRMVAYQNRNDYLKSEIAVRIAKSKIKYAKGGFYPTLSLEGVYSRKEDDPASTFLVKESIYGGLRLNFPFFEGGLRKAELSESAAELRQAELSHSDLKKTIDIEISNAYLDLKTIESIVITTQKQVAYAKDNYEAVSRQFEFGLADSIDVIDANTTLLSAERQHASAMYDRHLATLKLKKAMGIFLKVVSSGQ
ncbi:MAG: TolC family protein [Nitrospirota bacterium]